MKNSIEKCLNKKIRIKLLKIGGKLSIRSNELNFGSLTKYRILNDFRGNNLCDVGGFDLISFSIA
ncbi:hypothetical protein BpHYR1_012866 [Brachionus plicatilis]|uniref:Uncharacterized protein n=1 Tax=Brachionus plicatilis TaxID=10195 RepID=A0A3M7RZQ2_BRAPC|nr:hypothetical protein BpHYR1_012866 [Brachionus plicatilis]